MLYFSLIHCFDNVEREGPLNLTNLEYFKFIAESSSIKFAQEFITFVLQLLFLKRPVVANAPVIYCCDNCANRRTKTKFTNLK